MKRARCFLLLGCCWCVACGSATDVGNPENGVVSSPAPATADARSVFVGTYTSGALQTGESRCQTGTGAQMITSSTTDASIVLLQGFFSYSGLADPMPATVESGTTLAVSVSGETSLVCSGTRADTMLTLTCEVGKTTCTLRLIKQ